MNKEKIRSFFAFFKKWTFWRSAIFVIILFGLGVGFLWISYYYEGYIQNLLMGLGTGVVSSAIITIAFEINNSRMQKERINSQRRAIQKPLTFFISQVLEDLYLFIEGEEKYFNDFLSTIEAQDLENFIGQDKISILVDREIRKNELERVFEISIIALSTEAISIQQYEDIKLLHFNFNIIYNDWKKEQCVPQGTFIVFLRTVEKCIEDFNFLHVYKDLIYNNSDGKKSIKVKPNKNYSKEEKWALNLVTIYKDEKEQEKND